MKTSEKLIVGYIGTISTVDYLEDKTQPILEEDQVVKFGNTDVTLASAGNHPLTLCLLFEDDEHISIQELQEGGPFSLLISSEDAVRFSDLTINDMEALIGVEVEITDIFPVDEIQTVPAGIGSLLGPSVPVTAYVMKQL